MTQKTILITGCSSGIGLATAHYLRDQGWRVLASCRKAEDCARLESEGFDAPQIDYADAESVQSGLQLALRAANGQIDALFNNGAFASPGLAEDLPRGALREIFETNVIGVHDLTRQMIPIMRKQGHGRILQCSSVLGFTGARFRSAYVASKFALEGLADTLRLELMHDPIDVILIEPGPIESKIRKNAQAHFEKWIDWQASEKRDYYEKTAMPRLYDESGKKDKYELPALAVAKKVEKALLAKNPKARYFVTTPTYLSHYAKLLLPTKLRDKILMGA